MQQAQRQVPAGLWTLPEAYCVCVDGSATAADGRVSHAELGVVERLTAEKNAATLKSGIFFQSLIARNSAIQATR